MKEHGGSGKQMVTNAITARDTLSDMRHDSRRAQASL